jgi:hypothetical protein
MSNFGEFLGRHIFPMVGPWSGIRPWPTQVPPSDIELGLSSISVLRRLEVLHFFPLQLL